MLYNRSKYPKGPDFQKARKIQKELSGCKTSFLAPPQSDPYSSMGIWESEPNIIDINDLSKFKPLEWRLKSGELRYFSEVQTLCIYSNRWGFNGLPIIQGQRGDVSFFINVNLIKDLPVNETLFHNRVLAQETFRIFDLTFLQNLHKGRKSTPFDLTPSRWPSFLGPINFQWVNQGGSDWLYFESQPLKDDLELINWSTPITEKHLLSCQFYINRSSTNAGNAYRINQSVQRENYLRLTQEIMNTFEIELTSNHKQKYKRTQSLLDANEKPILTCTSKQIDNAKHVLQSWSDLEFIDSKKNSEDDHKASIEEVTKFLEDRIQPKLMPNSYPAEEEIQISSRIPPKEIQKILIGEE
ncbi:hypothetical protein Misp06_01226 [Microbulbifer sp. NBRC 101763]|uniref:hypothetical protein n=1 Tax=Microbulbifer TaxID=48073 RepID=UPI00036A6EE1|nr:hypothetical protein [Microbulbifer variabilis]